MSGAELGQGLAADLCSPVGTVIRSAAVLSAAVLIRLTQAGVTSSKNHGDIVPHAAGLGRVASHLTERAQPSRHDLDAGRQLGHRKRVYLIVIVTRRELLKFRDPVVEPGRTIRQQPIT